MVCVQLVTSNTIGTFPCKLDFHNFSTVALAVSRKASVNPLEENIWPQHMLLICSGMITEIRGPKEIYFIHASSSKGVREDNLISTYWMGCYATARRPF